MFFNISFFLLGYYKHVMLLSQSPLGYAKEFLKTFSELSRTFTESSELAGV